MTWKAWGDHPWIITVAVISGLVGIGSGSISIYQFIKPSQPSLDNIAPPSSPNNNTVNSELSTKAKSIGWIRLGAINHESGILRDGVLLIATSQPITVIPTVVPKDGDSVSTITGINLRKSAPKFPDYDPDKQEKLSVLHANTRLIVLQKVNFVDPKLPSTTIVWAEVGLKD